MNFGLQRPQKILHDGVGNYQIEFRNLPRGLTEPGIEKNILKLIGQNPGRYPWVKCLEDLLSRYPTPKPERYIDVLGRLIDEGKVQLLRSKGLALGAAVAKKVKASKRKRRPQKRERESAFYEPMKNFLERGEDFDFSYVGVVSEKGKKWKPLPAVPDVAAVAYLPSPFSDELELTLVEVKNERPNLHHLSETFRYSRFSDYCYVGISKEELQGYDQEYSRYLQEAGRLGIGVISYWRRGSKGRERFNIDLEAKKQTPDQIEKQEYLAYVVGIWKCLRCQTYRLTDEGSIIKKKLSEKLAGKDLGSETKRFLCASCQLT